MVFFFARVLRKSSSRILSSLSILLIWDRFEMIFKSLVWIHAFGLRSTYCMMDSTTRRVCKMPDAAQAELSPFFWDDRFVFEQTERGFLSNRIIKLDHLSAQYASPPLQVIKISHLISKLATWNAYGCLDDSVDQEWHLVTPWKFLKVHTQVSI